MADPKISHEFWQINGIRMHVAIAGEGEPLVLLHGFPEIWYSWRQVMPLLARNYTVVAPDLRGYGTTEVTKKGYRMEELGRDVEALIDRLGGKAWVVGHDWGGVIAWHMTSACPDKVRGLVAVAAPHPARYLEVFFTHLSQTVRGLYTVFFQIPVLPELMLSLGSGALPAWLMRKSTHLEDVLSEEELAVYRESWTMKRLRAGINYYRQMARHPFWVMQFHRKHLVRRPTMVVWGQEDTFLPLSQTEDLDKYCPDKLKIKIMPGTGHWIAQERPEILAEYITGFFDSVDK